ncbi:hypothetical protein BHM03_00041605 [Ensete ventricosum]|nr:hypothetical protein BHM03_00041605 [Ensete ventricosum]
MATEREKEREAELENAMYTNCLLLGLDPAVLGGGPRLGHFRHSNPKILTKFGLSSTLPSLVTSERFVFVADFMSIFLAYLCKLFWIIMSEVSYLQIVQGIISELESQGVLPRSNSRVSSLATCCGPRSA